MISVQEANIQNAEVIASFQVLMAKETEDINLDQDTVNKGVRAVFEDPWKGFYIIAVSDEKVIASLLLTNEWSDWRNGNILWIQSVYVLSEYRGQGVYRQMFEFVKNKIKSDENIMGLRLYVDKTNQKAQAVYAALGMNGDHYATFEWMKH